MKKKEMTVRELASLGGKTRAKKLTKARQSQIGRQAINVRWARYRAELKANGAKPTTKKRNKHGTNKRSKNTA